MELKLPVSGAGFLGHILLTDWCRRDKTEVLDSNLLSDIMLYNFIFSLKEIRDVYIGIAVSVLFSVHSPKNCWKTSAAEFLKRGKITFKYEVKKLKSLRSLKLKAYVDWKDGKLGEESTQIWSIVSKFKPLNLTTSGIGCWTKENRLNFMKFINILLVFPQKQYLHIRQDGDVWNTFSSCFTKV